MRGEKEGERHKQRRRKEENRDMGFMGVEWMDEALKEKKKREANRIKKEEKSDREYKGRENKKDITKEDRRKRDRGFMGTRWTGKVWQEEKKRGAIREQRKGRGKNRDRECKGRKKKTTRKEEGGRGIRDSWGPGWKDG